MLFSVAEAKQGRPGWVRAGQSVCYYRNLFWNPVADGRPNKAGVRRLAFGAGRQQLQRRPPARSTSADMTSTGGGGAELYSISFVLTFRHHRDVCYLAYHFPFTYTYLQVRLHPFFRGIRGGVEVWALQGRDPNS